MTKMRFEPQFFDHERWERLGTDPLVLHLAAVGYVCNTLSDGLVSFARVRTLSPLVKDPETAAARLLQEGLWELLEDRAQYRVCQVHDDLRNAGLRGDEQPSKAFVDKERERNAARKATFRAKKAAETIDPDQAWNGVPIPDQNAAQGSEVWASGVKDPEGPVLHPTEPAASGSPQAQEQNAGRNDVPPKPLSTAPREEDTCQHGTPNGRLLTRAGTPICLQCRQELGAAS